MLSHNINRIGGENKGLIYDILQYFDNLMLCNVWYLQYQNNTKSYMMKYKYFDELAKQSFFKFIYTKALALKLKDWGQIFVLSLLSITQISNKITLL